MIVPTTGHKTHFSWEKENMVGDYIKPGAHTGTFRITSNNQSGGLFSSLAAALTPIIDDENKKNKGLCAHKFTASMQQSDDLHTDLALFQETGSGMNCTKLANAYSSQYKFTHAEGHKASFGLAFAANEKTHAAIYGGTKDNIGSIQTIYLGSEGKRNRAKKFVTIFNVYAPTAPTAST